MGKENLQKQGVLPNKEILPNIPSFYIFKGISGAGCSTVIDEMVNLGLLHLAPPEFTTRPLRPNEIWGNKHHPISKEQLDKVRSQVVISELQYGNEYGFFSPAINRIKANLNTRNIVVDSGAPPSQWARALGSDYPIFSVFFAPLNPHTAIERIVSRAKKANDSRVSDYLFPRASENYDIVKRVTDFDFWVDTTELREMLTNVKTIIEATSYGKPSSTLELLSCSSNPHRIQQLIRNYENTNCVAYAKQLLGIVSE